MHDIQKRSNGIEPCLSHFLMNGFHRESNQYSPMGLCQKGDFKSRKTVTANSEQKGDEIKQFDRSREESLGDLEQTDKRSNNMRLTIRKGHLAEIYSGMAKMLSNCWHGVRIESAPGNIRAVGTNINEAIVYEAESPENENGEGTFILPTDPLKEIVNAYGSDTVITFSDEEETIKAEWETKGLTSSLTFQSKDDFPEITIPGGIIFKPLERDRFRTEYLLCAKCTTEERTRFDLDCIVLDGENNKMVATDGRQVYGANGIAFPWKDSCFLPTGKCFPEKLLLSSGTLEAVKTEKVLVFRNRPWTYSVTPKEGSFPPIEKLAIDIGDTELLLNVSETDAEKLIELLPHLPGNKKRCWAITLEARDNLTFHGESSGTESETKGELVLTDTTWIGGPCKSVFSREFFIRALKHGFRSFRFPLEGGPIVSESETGKYIFMPMRVIDEEDPEEEASEDSQKPETVRKPTPAEVRELRIEWSRYEALWLVTEYAQSLGRAKARNSPPIATQIRFQLESVAEHLSDLTDKHDDCPCLEELLPPQDELEWEEIGDFARADGTVVTLVRSEDGFFSIQSEEEVNLTAMDVNGILEPLLSQIWKPSCLALYYNGQRWWIDTEHAITRKGKRAERQLVVGEPRPASNEFIEWEIGIFQRLIKEYGDSLPTPGLANTERRLEKLQTWLNQQAPETLDLLPLCLSLPATA